MTKKLSGFQNITLLRQRDNLSQTELATLIGASQQAVARWEIGTSQPSIKKLLLMADVFDTTVDVLVGRAPLGKRRPTIEEKLLEFKTLQDGSHEAANVDSLTREVFEKYFDKPTHLARVCRGIRAVVDIQRTTEPPSIVDLVETILAATE